jgi:glycosyltransferase involved in cell wall biosynthesis
VFTVEFHGTFIPLQGIDTIIRSAKLLGERSVPVHFLLIGAGQTKHAMQKLAAELALTTVTFTGPKSPSEVRNALIGSDCALGIFGVTEKTQRVLPHKAFEILATARPLITALTPTSVRMLRDGKNALLVPAGDPGALADAIERLAGDREFGERIAVAGRALFEAEYQPLSCGRSLVHWITVHAHHGS